MKDYSVENVAQLNGKRTEKNDHSAQHRGQHLSGGVTVLRLHLGEHSVRDGHGQCNECGQSRAEQNLRPVQSDMVLLPVGLIKVQQIERDERQKVQSQQLKEHHLIPD